MSLTARIRSWWSGTEKPPHLRHGELGDQVASKHLKRQGLKFRAANFRSSHGEIDIHCRDENCQHSVYMEKFESRA